MKNTALHVRLTSPHPLHAPENSINGTWNPEPFTLYLFTRSPRSGRLCAYSHVSSPPFDNTSSTSVISRALGDSGQASIQAVQPVQSSGDICSIYLFPANSVPRALFALSWQSLREERLLHSHRDTQIMFDSLHGAKFVRIRCSLSFISCHDKWPDSCMWAYHNTLITLCACISVPLGNQVAWIGSPLFIASSSRLHRSSKHIVHEKLRELQQGQCA